MTRQSEVTTHRARRGLFARVKRGVRAIVVLDRATVPANSTTSTPVEQRPRAKDFGRTVNIVGSAFCIDSAVGIYATARHVIASTFAADGTPTGNLLHLATAAILDSTTQDGGAWIDFVTDSRQILAATVHPEIDVALVHVMPDRFINDASHQADTFLPLAAEPCEEGDLVAMCGFPLGDVLHDDQVEGHSINASFAEGIVSAILPFLRRSS